MSRWVRCPVCSRPLIVFGTRRVNSHRTWDGAWCIVRRVKDVVPTANVEHRELSLWSARAQTVRKARLAGSSAYSDRRK